MEQGDQGEDADEDIALPLKRVCWDIDLPTVDSQPRVLVMDPPAEKTLSSDTHAGMTQPPTGRGFQSIAPP